MVGGDDVYEMREREEFNEFLRQLIDTGDLRGKPAEGIAKLVLDKGQRVLSDKQQYVFDTDIVEEYRGICDQCREQVPWSEAYDFYHSSGTCETCQAGREKFMAD